MKLSQALPTASITSSSSAGSTPQIPQTPNITDPVKGHVFIVRANILALCCDAAAIQRHKYSAHHTEGQTKGSIELNKVETEQALKDGTIVTYLWKVFDDYKTAHQLTFKDNLTGSVGYLEDKEIQTLLVASINKNKNNNKSSNSSKNMSDEVDKNDPEVFSLDISNSASIVDHIATLVEYIYKCHECFKDRAPANRRERHLICVPIIGISKQTKNPGGIIGEILKLLYNLVDVYPYDYAIVSDEQYPFQACLFCRNAFIRENHDRSYSKHNLPEPLQKEAKKLAKKDSLAVFFGAGCSMAAGLPSWGSLIEKLAKKGDMNDEEISSLFGLNVLDQARIVARRLAAKGFELKQEIIKILSIRHYPLSYALLQALPLCSTFITTNYDTLFEDAYNQTHKKGNITVLPYDNITPDGKWVLKMHGCINHPEDIVLTRDDYIQYNDRRQALAGIVQSFMITKHMLFVGFSMNDDNFFSIANTVKKALNKPETPIVNTTGAHPKQEKPDDVFGTSLQLIKNPLMEELWADDVKMVNMIDKKVSGSDTAKAARRIEIFLDYLSCKSADTSQFLLKDGYDMYLSPDEHQFKQQMNVFLKQMETQTNIPKRINGKVRNLVEGLGGAITITHTKQKKKKAQPPQEPQQHSQ